MGIEDFSPHVVGAVRFVSGACCIALGMWLIVYCDETFDGRWTWKWRFLWGGSFLLWEAGFVLLLWKWW